MTEARDISRESSFYVPAFEVRVRGRKLDRTVINDVIKVEYVDDLKAIDQFSLTINNWDADRLAFKYSDNDLFLPKAGIEIDIGYLPDALTRVITGQITDMQVTFPAEGKSVLNIKGLNKLDELRGKQRSQVFENKTDSAMARQIVGETSMRLRTDASAEAVEEEHAFVFQHNQYDIVFLKDRARRLGYELVVEESDSGQPQLYFGPSDKIADRPVYKLTYGRDLIDFAPNLSTAKQVGKVEVHAWDHKRKRAIKGSAERGGMRTKGVGSSGMQGQIDGDLSGRVEIVADHPVRSQKEADILARELLEKNAKEMVKGSGNVVGLPSLRAGSVLILDGMGSRFSGRYFVTKTTHTIDDSGYRTRFDCRLEEVQDK